MTCSGPNPSSADAAGPSSGCRGMICCHRIPERRSRQPCSRRQAWGTLPWPRCSSRAWPRPRPAGHWAPSREGTQVSTRTRGSRGRTRLSIRYFDDRILLTYTYAWEYYRVPSVSYEFTTAEEREALATNITVALAAIRMADAEVHLRIVHRSYPAHAWATGLDATSDGGPGWREYLEQTYQHVWAKDFWAKEIYLGVRLGQRAVRAQLSRGVLSQFRGVYAGGEKELGINDEAVGTAEVAKWTDNAERLGRALNASALAARHASAGGIAWLGQPTLIQTAGEALGPGGDRHPLRGAGPQWPDPPAPRAHVRGKLCRFPVVCPLSRSDVLSRRGAVAAFRRFAAVPGGDQLADETHSAGQGEQGRQPPPGARARHGHPYPGGGRGGAHR